MVAALLPVEVEVEGVLYLVRRPTVREAMVLITYAEEPEAAWGELEPVLRGWVGEVLDKLLILPKREIVRRLAEMLRTGDEEGRGDGSQPEWAFLIATYARFYHMAPERVLDVSWPVFVTTARQIDRIRASEQLANAEWYAGAKGGKVDSIVRRASGTSYVSFEEPEIMKDEAWLSRQYETIRRLRQKQARA